GAREGGPAHAERPSHRGDGLMATQRRAEAIWHGNLTDGEGTIVANTSGVLPELPVSWASRAEEPAGKTSPEELIAAAHASCFAMALSNELAQGGHTAERLETSATVTFEPGEGIKSSALTVRGSVPGLSADEFQRFADPALSDLVAGAAVDVARIENDLKLALAPSDPADEKDVIVEIRQGVGGDEAALWAADLARILQKYAERRRYRWEELGVSPTEGG